MLDQPALRLNHVVNGDDRKTYPVGASRIRVNRRWAGAAVAASHDIRADHEVARGVEEASRADQRIPPCHLGIVGAFSIMRVRTACERVGNQHGIISRRVQAAPRLICHCHGAKLTAQLQRQGIERERIQPLRRCNLCVCHDIVFNVCHHCRSFLSCHST